MGISSFVINTINYFKFAEGGRSVSLNLCQQRKGTQASNEHLSNKPLQKGRYRMCKWCAELIFHFMHSEILFLQKWSLNTLDMLDRKCYITKISRNVLLLYKGGNDSFRLNEIEAKLERLEVLGQFETEIEFK